MAVNVDDKLSQVAEEDRRPGIQIVKLVLHRPDGRLSSAGPPPVERQPDHRGMSSAQEVFHFGRHARNRKRNGVGRQELPGLAGGVDGLCFDALAELFHLLRRPIDDPVHPFAVGVRAPAGLELTQDPVHEISRPIRVETEHEGRTRSGGRRRPDLGACGNFQHTLKAESLVADALVGVLRTLPQPADSVEVLLAEGATAVPDQKYRFGLPPEDERDTPPVARRWLCERIVGVLQELQHAAPPVLLRDLSTQAGDRPVDSRAVLQLIKEGLHLLSGLSSDELVACSSRG